MSRRVPKVGLVDRDEHTVAAAAARVRHWTNVSVCAPANPSDASASWAQLRLVARGADGRELTLMPLYEAVEQRYTAYFRLRDG